MQFIIILVRVCS